MTLFSDKGQSTRKLIFSKSVCSKVRHHSQKVLNKVTFLWDKGAVGYNRKNLLTQRSNVANTKATTYFPYIPTVLTSILPGTQWVRDMETWQQALAQQ